MKAYLSRVGESPLPTEINGEAAKSLREKGGEYGTTTGRPRRVGWLDLVQVRQAVRVNGLTEIALTKLDVLDELDEIKICVKYQIDGKDLDYLPAAVEDQLKVKPVYKTLPGWKTSTKGVKKMEDLPENARRYIKEIEKFVNAKISSVSTSPEREDTILLESPFGE